MGTRLPRPANSSRVPEILPVNKTNALRILTLPSGGRGTEMQPHEFLKWPLNLWADHTKFCITHEASSLQLLATKLTGSGRVTELNRGNLRSFFTKKVSSGL